MKTLLFTLLLCVATSAIAQSDSALRFKEAVSIQGVSKDELFERAKLVLKETLKTSKFVLESENKETGELSGKGVMTTMVEVGNKPITSKISYDMYIKVINGRYLVHLSNFIHQYVNQEFTGFGLLTTSDNTPVKLRNQTPQAMNELWQQVKQEVSIRVEPLMDKLQVSMRKKATEMQASNNTPQ